MNCVLPDPPRMLEGREVQYPMLDVFNLESAKRALFTEIDTGGEVRNDVHFALEDGGSQA